MNVRDIVDLAADRPVYVIAAAVLALVVLVLAVRAVRRAVRGHRPEDVLTNIVAGLATSVSAQGMFRFFSDRLEMPWWMQPQTFFVFELAQVACALRARRNIRETGSAGVDGALVWAMSAVSAVLSATDSHGWAAFARMLFPFSAAVLWERGLRIERKRSRKRDQGVQSRLTFERLLVWLRLAEPSGRTASDVDAHRRITRVARYAHRVRVLTATGAWVPRVQLAERRLAAAMRAAVEHAGIADDETRQAALMAQLGALYHARALADIEPQAPWDVAAPLRVPAPSTRLYRVPNETLRQAAAELLDQGTGDDLFPDTPASLVEWLSGEEPEADVPEDEVRVPEEEVHVPQPADPHQIQAAELFVDEVRQGRVPGIRTIKRKLRVGQDKATEVRAYLCTLAEREAVPVEV